MFSEKNEAKIEFEKETPEEKLKRSENEVKKELDEIEPALGNLFFKVEEGIEEKRKEAERARAEGKPASEVEKIYNHYLRFSNIHDMLWRRFDLLNKEQFIGSFDEYAGLRKEMQAERRDGAQTFDWPIVRGEIFRPRRELHEIKSLPRSEKKQKLEEFKEKLAYQKEGLAEMQEIMMLKIRENPDVLKDELMKEVEYFAGEFGFNEWQKMAAESAIDIYLAKHQKVRETRLKYLNNTDLFFALFGQKPEGEIEVIEGPMTLYFRCRNIADFVLIAKKKFVSKKPITKADMRVARSITGISITPALVEGLEGTILAENAEERQFDEDAKNTLMHEEEHALQRFFALAITEKEKESDFIEMISKAESAEEKTNLIKRYLRFLRREKVEWYAKGELLAYFKEGSRSADKIFDELMKSHEEGGVYDYIHTFKLETKIVDNLIKHIGSRSLVREAASSVFNVEYPNLLIKAIEAFENLKRYYNSGKAVEILRNEPLANWKKVAARLLAANRWHYEKWRPQLKL